MTERGSWPEDTRGIIDPAEMRRLVDFARYRPVDELEGLIDWFWSVSWTLPAETVHMQEVLNHPSGHVSVGTVDDSGVPLDPARGRVYGVLTGISQRRLTGSGWTVAAKTTTGGLGVLIDRPAREITDCELDLVDALPGCDGAALSDQVRRAPDPVERVEVLQRALLAVVAARPAGQVAEARRVAAIAAVAERDRTVCRVDQLAAAGHVSVRSLQRLFDTHVGVSPSWIIRRWRIIEAAESAKAAFDAGPDQVRSTVEWSELSARLGYADQSHLIRDFQRHLGTTPGHYLRRNQTRQLDGS